MLLVILAGQCLKRRIGDIDIMRKEIAWVKERNESLAGIDWWFITDDARIKFKRLYPKL